MVFNSDIRNGFQQLGQSLSSLKNLTGDITSQIDTYGNAVKLLTPKQQALALATKDLTTAQIMEIMRHNEVAETEIVEALSSVNLINKKKELSIAVAKETLTQALGNEEKAKSIMASAGIVASDGAETVSKKQVSVATLEAKLSAEGLGRSEISLIMTQMGLSTSTVTLSNYFKGLAASTWASVKAIGAFLVTNPVGWCILAAGAVAGVVAIVDGLTTSFEEQKEITEKLQDEYNDLTEQISKVESELKNVTDRVDELNSKEHLTFVEKEELENLEKTTFQLERQNELLKEQQELKAKELHDSIKKEYEKDFQSKDILDGTYATREEKIQVKLDYYKKYKDNEDYLREWSDEIEETRQYLIDSALDIQDYISRYGVDDETSQSWKDLFESIDRVLDPTAYKTKDFNDIINWDKFKDDVEEINNLLDSGELDKNALNKQFPELVEAMSEFGLSVDDVVEQFYALHTVEKEQNAQNSKSTRSLEDLKEAYDELSKSASTYTSNQKTLTDALEEQEKHGQLSASTIQSLTEAGYAQALAIDKETGAVTLNIKAYEWLNEQKRQSIILEAEQQKSELEQKFKEESKAITELATEMQYANQERREAIALEMQQHGLVMADIQAQLSAIDALKVSTAAPTFESGSSSSSKSEKPQSVLDYEKWVAEQEHKIAMSQLKEDEAYYNEKLRRAEIAYSGLADYESDLWKVQEEVYKGRKKLAQEAFDKEHDLFENRVDDLEDYADKLSETSITSDGTNLTTQEKWQEVAAVYKEIQSEIEREINRIVQVSVEGNEDLLEELEKQWDEYADKISDTFKSAVEAEKSLLENQKSSLSDVYNKEIDKIKKQQEDSKNAADAEIDLIQEKIDNLKKVNDEKQQEYDIEKAKQDLEKAKQKTRMVYGADGTVSYRQDDEKIAEAQQNLDKLLLEKQVNALETQKSLLEDMRDKESESYDKLIEDIESQKEQDERQFDILIQRLEDYLNPNSDTSNSDVWSEIAKMDGVSYKNGKWVDKDGTEIDITKLLSKADEIVDSNNKVADSNNKAEDNVKTDTANKKSGNEDKANTDKDNAKKNASKTDDIQKEETKTEKVNNQLETAADIIGKVAGSADDFVKTILKTLGATSVKDLWTYSSNGIPNGNQVLSSQHDTSKWTVNRDNYVTNNTNQPVSMTFGDINVNNPVGDAKKLAKEVKSEIFKEAMMQIPNVAMKQIHTNLR